MLLSRPSQRPTLPETACLSTLRAQWMHVSSHVSTHLATPILSHRPSMMLCSIAALFGLIIMAPRDQRLASRHVLTEGPEIAGSTRLNHGRRPSPVVKHVPSFITSPVC